jgi:hypothetical protein
MTGHRRLDWQAGYHARSAVFAGFDDAPAANLFCAFAHRSQSHPRTAHIWKADTIIFNL